MEKIRYMYNDLREQVIPFSKYSNYKKIRIIGGTGAGKSQFMRHLLDTEENDFPAIATGKCTVSKVEVISNDDGFYNGVITLYRPSFILSKLDELIGNMIATGIKYIDFSEKELLDKIYGEFRKISNQTFKLNFLLKMQDVEELLVQLIDIIKESTTKGSTKCKEEIDEETYNFLYDTCKSIRNSLFDIVIERVKVIIEQWYNQLENYGIKYSLDYIDEYKDFYPARICIYNVMNKKHFLSLIHIFTDNNVKNSGNILNTITEGVRISGNFRPSWYQGSKYNFIFVDGIGLGHSPEHDRNTEMEAEKCDTIIYLKDIKAELSATEEEIIETFIRNGWTDKMIFAFTHFDDTLSNPELMPKDFKARKEFVTNNFVEALEKLKKQQIKKEKEDLINDNEMLQLSISSIERRYTDFSHKVKSDSFAFCLRTNKIDIEQVRDMDESYDVSMEKDFTIKESNILISEYLNSEHIYNLIHKTEFKYSEKLFVAAIILGINEFNIKWGEYKALDGRSTWRTIKALCAKYGNDINCYCSYDIAKILSNGILEKINAVIDSPKTDADQKQISLITEKISLQISKRIYSFICDKMYYSLENKINWQDADQLRQYTNGSAVTYRKGVIDKNNSMATKSLCDVAIKKKRDIDYQEIRLKSEFLKEILKLIEQSLKSVTIQHNDMLYIEIVKD